MIEAAMATLKLLTTSFIVSCFNFIGNCYYNTPGVWDAISVVLCV